MQNIQYLLFAYSPVRQRRMAALGLAPDDSRWILDIFGGRFKGGGVSYRVPVEQEAAVYQRLFAEGIPEGCHFYFQKVRKKLPGT